MNVKTDYELGKVAAARQILNLLEEVYFSSEYSELRINKGSNGTRDFILNTIKDTYQI